MLKTMNFKTIEGSENYQAIVVKLPNKKQVPGLDNLVEVTIFGNSCLISKDSDENSLYLYFPSETELSKEFLSNNNLYRHSELNVDTTKSGYFEDSGRVRSVKFKGIISTCFLIPINSLVFANLLPNSLIINDSFNIFNDIEICKKYIKPSKVVISNNNQPKVKNIVNEKLVPRHFDTPHFFRNLHKIEKKDYVVITEKLHGTSVRYFYTPIKRKLNFLERFLQKLGVSINDKKYAFITGSRNTIKSIDNSKPKKGYYEDDIYTELGHKYLKDKLNKGEAVYGEIIGNNIQKGYSYDLKNHELYVYRISNINEDGVEIDLSYEQMVTRAEQLGVKIVPLVNKGLLFINDTEDVLTARVNMYLNNKSLIDGKTVNEGVVIRIDKDLKPTFLKAISSEYLLKQTKLKDSGEEDMEESN